MICGQMIDGVEWWCAEDVRKRIEEREAENERLRGLLKEAYAYLEYRSRYKSSLRPLVGEIKAVLPTPPTDDPQ